MHKLSGARRLISISPLRPCHLPEEFTVATGRGDGLENIWRTAFTATNALRFIELPGKRNVGFDMPAIEPAEQLDAMEQLSSGIATSVGGNVDMVFAEEGGERVVTSRAWIN